MKPLTETQRKERGQAILLAAERVMAARGFGAFTVQEAAREAGLAKGTLFLYYRNKDELALAVFTRLVEAHGRALRAAAESGRGPEAVLRGLVLALLEHMDKKRDIAGYSGGFPLSAPSREKIRALFADNMQTIAGALARCDAAGYLDIPDPLFAASALFGLCRGSNSYARAAGRRLPLPERAARILRIFTTGVRREE